MAGKLDAKSRWKKVCEGSEAWNLYVLNSLRKLKPYSKSRKTLLVKSVRAKIKFFRGFFSLTIKKCVT